MSKLKRSVLYWILLAPLIVLTLFPFAVMLVTALKPTEEMLSSSWWPSRPVWGNFVTMYTETAFGPALANSLIVSLVTTVLTVLVAIPAAYALSRYRFAARGAFRQFLLISQMLSPIVLVFGLFRLLVELGNRLGFQLIDSLSGVTFIYIAFNLAFAVWMLQSYFSTIPKDLEEAAWIEGASPFATLVKVFLPLALPAMAVTAIFTFINAWNEYVIALTMLRKQEAYTLPLQVVNLVAGRYTVEWNYVMAAALAATIPIAILFTWLQRYLMRGLALGAVK
ncbi:carbohydrate ABC transporter permease [Labrys neptuniae]|uniref:Maltose/maltodextrin transport system permease protein MalG n=2 Tax=Labrys neptuniae TaxID=376174 RepID=A0ABV3PX46_9HYPH|nr:carbohydrate ABC transporter permease [Labrys neptuniae]MDT3375735.1 carbohydrate ABC transporter permease [Labrys neptuniae]